jgi:Sulfatase
VARWAIPTLLLAAALALPACARDSEPVDEAERRPPVVVLILDEFPTDDLLRPDGTIDGQRFPNFARLARISTWFPNAYTVYDSTFKAVPAILDARMPARGTVPDVRSHQPSIYHLMDRLGYEVHKVESASAVCPPRICLGTRTRRPSVLDRLKGGGRPARLHNWMGKIHPRERPGFYLHHALFPHEPWLYLPSGRPNRPSGEDPIKGINLPWGFADTRLSEHNHLRHLLQAGYTDLELGRLLDRLAEQGMLRRSLIVVVADHGYGFDIGAESRRFADAANVEEVASVPMFVKAPGQMEGEVDESLVRNLDVAPTIADLLGTRLWWPNDGHSAFSEATREREQIAVPTRDFSETLHLSRDEFERRRAANRVRWARLFGTGQQSRLMFGDPWARAYRIGPNTPLLDRRVGSLPVRRDAAASTGVVAKVANAELARNVRRDDGILPTRITGRLAGASREGVRDLAVAVNGRVRAVGRSFRLGERPAEYFSFVVPESAIRLGENRVDLFEVRRGGRLLVTLPDVPQGAAR